MRTQKIYFPEQQALCVFPDEPANLAQSISTLGLKDGYPVIVLIGDEVQEQQALVTHGALETLARVVEDTHALVICGGRNLGIMAEIGELRWRNGYKFPLVGITLEALVTWPDGPHSTNMLWWGTKRWELEPHCSHFILVPGGELGDESRWIADAATLLSKGCQSVTILINGEDISRKDIELSIENGRPVIAFGGTGHLANELASEPNRDDLISVVPASAMSRVDEAVRAAIAGIEKSAPTPVRARAMLSTKR
jgi:hypothetical protein